MVADYYEMLGIEPSADQAAIAAALTRCQPLWSSGTRNPKNKHKFQSYLDQIPAIRQTLLGDPATRAAYDAELAASRRLERDRKLDELQRLLHLRAAKGGLTVSDRNLLRAEAVKLGLSHDDLDRLAEPIPPQPETPHEEDDPEPPADAIDPATRRQIRVSLEHLRRRDLYHVLDLPRDAPREEIIARADEERKRWMQKAQVTAEKTAWLEAVSYAQSHLSSPEGRARYDRTLVLESEESFTTAIAFALTGLPRLDPGTRRVLVDEAARLGIPPDRTDRLIGRQCRALNVNFDGGAPSTPKNGPPRYLRCRVCGGVTEFAQASRSGPHAGECRHCHAPLRWDCPVCQKSHWVDEPRCPCGFLMEHREPLIRHFEAAQHAHKVHDYNAALAHLKRVQQFAPRHVGARKGIEKIKERLAEIDRARSTVAVEQARRHLVAARSAIDAWSRLVDPTDPDLRQAREAITKELREAHALAAKARILAESDPSSARELLRQALAIAADLPEARDSLRRCAPDPPGDLRVGVDGERVRLRWKAPPPDGLGAVSYRVVRKSGDVPAHATDGTTIAEVDGTEYEDTRVTPGASFGYAVFTHRADIDSIEGSYAGPVLVRAEVRDVRVESRSREVQLSWTMPASACGVRVVRKAGSDPTGPDDGEIIESLREHAHDRGLRDDRVYHYGIYALYRTSEGRLAASRGVTVSAMPHAPVRGIGGLSAAEEPDGRVRLTWREPERGQVRILRTSQPTGLPSGTRLGPGEAEALEGHWLDVTETDHAFDARPPEMGVWHYTPMTSWAGQLTVGESTVFSRVPDPTDLRASREGGSALVRLRWRWSPQAPQSLVVARAGGFPTAPDDPARFGSRCRTRSTVVRGFTS